MAPYPQIHSRDTSADDDVQPNPLTPMVIGGIAFAGALILAVCLWLGIRTYRKRSREQRADGRQGAFLTVKGLMSEDDEKAAPPRIAVTGPGPFSREQLTASIVMPHQNIVRPDATNDEILHYHTTTGTMTRPFSNAASSTLAPGSPVTATRPISTVSYLSAADAAPRRSSFFGFGNSRPVSSASSTYSAASTILGVEGRKVRQLFPPVLPDELVLSLGERVTVVQSFDDGWCIVGRGSLVKPGEVEMGAVPAWCFIKPVKGLKASRPMRTSSLGVTVQLDAGPGFSSRDELISWSNF
ncbi:hypothetical protein EDB85DRAFT_1370571 [Lactarius pseudohatsudake]|nr:hypothetical protein EDB85DRAFT_1370571 [Lactarius pseudohatsudake]